MTDMATRSVIVTGGGSGIGAAVCLDLSKAGYNVTVADVNVDGGNETVARVRDAGGKAHFIRTDVSVEADVIAMVDSAVASYGTLDAACNAAGICQRGKIMHELTAEEWDRCIAINLRGLFLCNKYQVRAMLDAGRGAIVNIASAVSMVAVPNGAEYCASKAGVMGLVRGIAVDYATKGIRINAVLPGGTRTPMLTTAIEADPTLEAALVAVHPMDRFCEPSEIAGAVRWLLSEEAGYVTGSSIAVDGGMLAI